METIDYVPERPKVQEWEYRLDEFSDSKMALAAMKTPAQKAQDFGNNLAVYEIDHAHNVLRVRRKLPLPTIVKHSLKNPLPRH